LHVARKEKHTLRMHEKPELQGPTGYCCIGKQSLFIVRPIWNTQIRSLGRKLSPYLTGNVSVTKHNQLMLFRERVAVYCENHMEHTNILCGQKTQPVPHRKHTTSPLQSPTSETRLAFQGEYIYIYIYT
jgi:hypothetical protein